MQRKGICICEGVLLQAQLADSHCAHTPVIFAIVELFANA